MVTLTVQIGFDPNVKGDREAAHAAVDAICDSVLTSGTARIGAKDKGHLVELQPDDLRAVLVDLATGRDGVPLNEGERAMLRAIAESSPDSISFVETRRILGSGPKFGNVSSALTRRFENRGFKLPYKTVALGFSMPGASAAVVLAVLDETGDA